MIKQIKYFKLKIKQSILVNISLLLKNDNRKYQKTSQSTRKAINKSGKSKRKWIRKEKSVTKLKRKIRQGKIMRILENTHRSTF